MPVTNGIPFEEYVWSNWWLRNFPTSDWSSEQQVSLAGSYKIDFVAYCGDKRAIGDAKDKARLTVQDAQSIRAVLFAGKPQRAIVGHPAGCPAPILKRRRPRLEKWLYRELSAVRLKQR
jgi:hypothetical protein